MNTAEIASVLEKSRKMRDDCFPQIEEKFKEQVFRLGKDSRLGLVQYEDEPDFFYLCPNGDSVSDEEEKDANVVCIEIDNGKVYFCTDFEMYCIRDFDPFQLLDLVEFLGKQ